MVILGLGNELRGDDALGILAAKKIQFMQPDLPVFIPGDTAGVLDYFHSEAEIILIDCMQNREFLDPNPTSPFIRIDLLQNNLESLPLNSSSHGFSLPNLFELATNLNIVPTSLLLFGLEGNNFTIGANLSKKLEENLGGLCQQIIREVNFSKRYGHA